jgi:general secretion pathway protein G
MKMNRTRRDKQAGFSVLESVAVLAALSTLLAVVIPAVDGREDNMRMVQVQKDFGVMELRIQRYFASNGEYPPSLDAVGLTANDPWGNPYQYLNSASEQGNGQKRKKHGNVPVNNDFDLYSMGPDGGSVSSMTATSSRDDIVRADKGDFVGWAAEYCVKSGC